jgi:hypothetical protein
MLQDKVARLRQLMSEAVPKDPPPTAEVQALKLFQLHEFNSAPALILDQSPRSRAEREIERIASWYGWTAEIARALDRRAAPCIAALADDDVDRLLDRMKTLEDCVREGLDCPDAPPAR